MIQRSCHSAGTLPVFLMNLKRESYLSTSGTNFAASGYYRTRIICTQITHSLRRNADYTDDRRRFAALSFRKKLTSANDECEKDMNIFKRLFNKKSKSLPGQSSHNMFSDLGAIKFEFVKIIFSNYPFEPSTAFRKSVFKAEEIKSVDISSIPPAIEINNELLFISAMFKDELIAFCKANNIKSIERPDVWSLILEPYLDTEFTDDKAISNEKLLAEQGLPKETVAVLRQEIGEQMYKYNFDTMLWEWVHLGLEDVLSAMREKYNNEEFREFYIRAMKIALLEK